MNFAFYWPIGLMIIASTFYQISAKSIPNNLDPFGAIFINYITAAVFSFLLWMAFGSDKSISGLTQNINWAPFILALSITFIEVSTVFMYKVGWDLSIGSLVANVATALILIVVGLLFYKEIIVLKQAIGILLCLGGLVLINN